VNNIIIGECIDWAFRHGYTNAEAAAKAFAEQSGLILKKECLGTYGVKLVFIEKPEPRS